MKTIIHQQITTEALKDLLHPEALQRVINSNMRQDSWWAQLGWHDHFHMDNSAFSAGNTFIAQQHLVAKRSIDKAAFTHDIQTRKAYQVKAWQALGRLTHAAQDFYAHSNYCALWVQNFATPPSPEAIDPLVAEVLSNPVLRSGKGSLLELLSFLIPALKPMTEKILGPDSHMHMNLDHPGRGFLYPYAHAAAIKRTQMEYKKLTDSLAADKLGLLTGNTI